MNALTRGLGVVLTVAFACSCGGSEQAVEQPAAPSQPTTTIAAAPAAPPAPAATPSAPPAAGDFTVEQIEALVAPIALFPDTLVAQVLAASTYPLEVVEASRWVGAHPDVKGDDLAAALEDEDWDPSVQSLVSFPSVLDQMSENLDWTKDLGDAFLGQQDDVLDAVQRLRLMAQRAGTLATTEQQKVVVEEETVTIEPAKPDTVYVPAYNPSTAYGSGWAPPPQQYYQPMYQDPWGSVLTHGLAFGAGVAVGGLIWGVDWDDDDDVHIHYDDHHDHDGGGGGKKKGNVNVNKNVNVGDVNIGNRQSWQHRSENRRGVSYRNENVANRVREREGARDRPGQLPADAGREDRMEQARAGLSQREGQAGVGRGDRPRAPENVARGFGPSGGDVKRPDHADRTRPQAGQQPSRDRQPTRPQAAQQPTRDRQPARPQAAQQPTRDRQPARQQAAAQRPRSGPDRTAFAGSGRSGSYERAASARGASSRGMQRSVGGGGYGGGGGGGRGGGGGGGRGGGGRRR
jgi:hypothetical protein